MRAVDVAILAGVSLAQVEPVSVDELRRALVDRASVVVLDVATQEPATYWRVGHRYFLDDPDFGPVVEFTNLDYSQELGLFDRTAFPDVED